MAYPRDTTGYVYAPGQEPDVVVESGAISITPPSARSQPRSPQGQKLVDEYALRFSDTTGGAAARAFKSPTDFFDPQKREAALTEAKAEPGFGAGKLRALQGGVGLPVYDKPDAPLRAGLPSGAEPWAAEKAPAGVAPPIAAPIREDADTDYEVRKDIIEKYSPVPREAIGRPGFGSVAGFTRGGNAELEPLEGMSPEQADVEWADRAIAKPTQFGTLSKPTVTEQVAMFPFGLGAGLAEKTLETVGLNSPERAIPLGGGGIYGYETGRDAPEVAARLPAAFLKGAANRIGAGYDAAMETPMTSGDGFWGYVEDMANSTGNALEAMTGVPRSSFEWDTSDYYERTQDDPEVVAARTEDEQLAIEGRRDAAEASGEQTARERVKAKIMAGDVGMMPTLGAAVDDVRRVAEAAIMLPIEAVTATGDPTLTAQERANRLGTLGSDLVFGGAGSAVRSVVSPRESWTKTPAEHLFNVGMLMRGAGLTPTAPPSRSPQEAWKRVDLEEMVGEREKAYGFEKSTREGTRLAKEINDDLELSGFFRSPEAQAAVDSRVVLAEAQRRLADTEALIQRTQTARPVVGDVLFEGATKSEQAVPAAQDAVKGERAGLSDAARAAADAETLAMQRVAVAEQALKDHMGARPLGEWGDVTREAFKAKRDKSASAARPTTKNRPFGEATVKAQERNERAQGKLKEFKPWFDEFKRLKREAKKVGTEAAKAREAARKARQDDGKLDELTQAEQDARIGREAVREAGTTARKSLPKVSELQEAAKAAREAVKVAKAENDAAASVAGGKIPSALSRHVGTLELERAAMRKRVADAGQEVAVAEQAIQAARAKYDAEFAQAEAALNAAEQKKAGAQAGARPPGVREASKAAAPFKAERARLRGELDAAKAEEAAALKVLADEQGGASDAFGAVKRARDAQHAEALDRARQGETLTPEQMKAQPLEHASAAEWAQAAREAVAETQARFDEVAAGESVAKTQADLAKYANLPPAFREKIIGLEDRVRTLGEAVKSAREQAAAASDPMVDNLRRYVEKDYAQAKAQLAEAQSLVRRNESQRQQSVRNSDAAATAVRNRMALRRRQHERVLMKLAADRNVAQRRLRSLTDDLAKVADPLKEAVERGTAAAEGLKSWMADKEPAFQTAVKELNKLEDDFAKSESKHFWTEQLVRMAPKHVATMGASLVYEVAKRLASNWLDTKGREWLKYALKTKDSRISQAFDNILENAAGRAEIMKMGLEEAFRRIPKEHRPTVAKWLDMEHSLAEGGWWRAGNYNFKAGEAPGHLSKFDPATGKWSVTEAGQKHLDDAMAQAEQYPEGSPEWADAMNEVQRFQAEMEVANTWGTALAMQLKAVEAEAAAAGLPRDPESLRPVWLPQVMTEAAQKKARQKTPGERAAAADAKAKVAARADAFTDSKPGSKPVPREQDAPMVQPDMKEYESSMLRKTRVPMTERELRYGMETDLGKRVSAVGRLVWDVQLRTIYNHIGDTMALTDEAKKLKRAVPEAQQAARGTGDRRAVEAFDKSWKKLEDDPKYGTAAGKWIPADVYFELANMENLAREAQGIVNRAMSKWKEWQVTGNPTALNRNIGVNALVFAPAAGISLLNPRNLPIYSEVVADLMRSFDQRDPLHREMVANNSLDSGMMKSELMREVGDQYLGAFQRGGVEPMKAFLEMMYEGPRAAWKVTTNPVKALSESAANKQWFKEYDDPSLTSDQRLELLKARPKPGVLADAGRGADAAFAAGGKALDAPFAAMREYHRFGDQVFKEVFYRKRRREGVSPEQAKKELDQHFPKYNTVPGFAHVVKAPHSIIGPNGKPITALRGVNLAFSVPFVAYTATSIPIFMKWAKENPAQGAAYMAFHSALTGANLTEAGLSKEQADAIEKAMPAYRRTSERLTARFAPKLAKTSGGDWKTVNTQFANPAAEFIIPQDDTVSDTENALSAFKSTTGFMEHPFLAPLIGVLGKDITQPTAPDIYESGDPDVAERIFNYSMKKLAHPLFPSMSSIASGDLGYGENRGQPGRLEGGKITQGLEMSRGGAPNRLGRRVSEDDFAASLMGLKMGYTSEQESARSISEQIKDRFVRAERAAVAATSQQQLRMNELEERDPAAFTAAQRRVVSQVLPFISQSVDRMRALKGDPVVAEYLDNYAPVIEAWNKAKSAPTGRRQYEELAAYYRENGWPIPSFEEWARGEEAWYIDEAYQELRAATGAGTKETGDARRETRTGETQ